MGCRRLWHAFLMSGLCIAVATVGAASAEPTRLTYFGLIIQRADAGSPWPSFAFGSWRLWDANVGWPQLEPERGRWDFKRLDRYLALAKMRDVEVTLPLGLTPTWASARPEEKSGYRPGNAAEPVDLEDWKNYVRVVAERYKGRIRYYEIWNEPSDKLYFTGDLTILIRLVKEAYLIIKSVDPQAKVVSPGLAGGGRHLEYLDAFLAGGGKQYVDIVGHHFYVYKEGPEAMVPLIRDVRRVMQKNGIDDKPLWNTETGWWIANGDGTPDHPMVAKRGWRKLALKGESGSVLARAFLLARSEGVERFFWYAWDSAYGLGMVELTTKREKPMAATFGRIVEWMQNAVISACDQNSQVWICPIRSVTTGDGWIVWREDGEKDWIVPNSIGATKRQGLSDAVPSPLLRRTITDLGASPVRLTK